jgi:hypothetical protein
MSRAAAAKYNGDVPGYGSQEVSEKYNGDVPGYGRQEVSEKYDSDVPGYGRQEVSEKNNCDVPGYGDEIEEDHEEAEGEDAGLQRLPALNHIEHMEELTVNILKGLFRKESPPYPTLFTSFMETVYSWCFGTKPLISPGHIFAVSSNCLSVTY